MIVRSSSYRCITALIIGAVILSAGCTPAAHFEKDKTADFSHYKTYSWAEQNETKKGKKQASLKIVIFYTYL